MATPRTAASTRQSAFAFIGAPFVAAALDGYRFHFPERVEKKGVFPPIRTLSFRGARRRDANGATVSEPNDLLTANLPLIERAVAFACRRYRLDPDDAEEFRSTVHLKLLENDGAVLHAYEARSRFATFINVVVQ